MADIVTWSPTDRPGTLTAGVVSFVKLSVDDAPASEDDSTSGAPGTGAAVSTVRDIIGDAAATLPAESVIEPDTDHDPSERAGRSHEVAEPTK